MEQIGFLNNKNLLYQRYKSDLDWVKLMPEKNWLLFIISNDKKFEELDDITCAAIDNDVCYACCVGKQGSLLDDMIDEEFVIRELGHKVAHLPPFDVIMTTWHSDLDEAFWFAIFSANNEPYIIDTIFCLDASENPIKGDLENLLNKYLREA